MIKYLTYCCSLVLSFGCQCQKDGNFSVVGNWTVLRDNTSSFYNETYIDSSKVYQYDINSGYNPSIKYEVKNDTLYFLSFKPEFQKIGKILISGSNQFLVTQGNQKVVFQRINDSLPKLENYVKGYVTKEEYWQAFLTRMRKKQ